MTAKAKTRLRHARANGRFCHAYLIIRGDEEARLDLAMGMAGELLCESACEAPLCYSCKAVASGSHPDLHRIAPDKKTGISAEHVREGIVAKAMVKPYHSPRNVFIIEKADTLNVTGQNILLKTLEEPPGESVFFLLAEGADAFLPTVLSRAAIVSLGEKPAEALSGKALAVLKDIIDTLQNASSAEILLKVKALEEFRDEYDLMLDYCLCVGALCAPPRGLRAVWLIEDAREKLQRNVGFLIVMETLFLRLKAGENQW